MRTEELTADHLEEAARLFAASFRREREAVPILDENIGSAETVLPRLRSCLEKNPGAAVFEGGKMVGYMAGFEIEKFLGVHRGAYCPEWAHASAEKNAFEIYRLLYRELGQQWVEGGCLTHAINFLDHASEARDAFCMSGFGDICVDAIRPVGPVTGKLPADLRVKPMREDDIPLWLEMVHFQTAHLAASPAFVPYLERETEESLLAILKQPGSHAWMAWHGSEAVGYMKTVPIGNGAAWIVNGEKKYAINGAYVAPAHRGKGASRALLSAVMGHGTSEDLVRCSVDFEATNIEACHFWLKHFSPVCRSMVRRLDERILDTIK